MSPVVRRYSKGQTALPTLFIDRSLGRHQVPAGLRAAGLRVVTLAEHYGVPRDQSVADVTWLAETAALGWVSLGKDARLRRRPAEREVIRLSGARCLYFTRADLVAAEYLRRVLSNLDAISSACAQPGPFIYVIHPARLERMTF